jgi:hypothetical protein
MITKYDSMQCPEGSGITLLARTIPGPTSQNKQEENARIFFADCNHEADENKDANKR